MDLRLCRRSKNIEIQIDMGKECHLALLFCVYVAIDLDFQVMCMEFLQKYVFLQSNHKKLIQ